jgi:hypothetical protein
MAANPVSQQTSLIDALVEWLKEHLPDSWAVERSGHRVVGQGQTRQLDDIVRVIAPDGVLTRLAVEARESLQPRDIERLLPGIAQSLRALAGNVPLVVVAPWLSPRVQELLAAQQINYLDLTGNALVRLDSPALFIKSAGATRNPSPSTRAAAGLRGPKAARLVRLLADVRPPYSGRELAFAARLTPGYVSRLLDTLDREAVLSRERRGRVVGVDVPALLRAWAQSYDVLKANLATPMLAANGAADALARLPLIEGVTAVTGSFAAVRLAPVAAPALLLIYCQDIEATARGLGLLPADEGANVVLLAPFDEVVWERASPQDGISYCAPSQVAVDCLTGTGRMPAEGEALLEWMGRDPSWRVDTIATQQAKESWRL